MPNLHPRTTRWMTAMVACTACMTPAATGHDYFLLATPPRLERPGGAMVRMHVTDEFPGEPTGWRADKITGYAIIGPDAAPPAGAERAKEGAEGVRISLLAPGQYLVAIATSASSISLEAKDFDEYIEHEGHETILAGRGKPDGPNGPVRERYTRFVKTIVTVGHPNNGRPDHVRRPVGHRIEIIPLADTATLGPGDQLPVQVLYDGRPLGNALISATDEHYTADSAEGPHDHGDTHYAFSTRTGGHGGARIPIARAGRQLLRVTHMIPLPDDKDFDYQSYWASLTFHVGDAVARSSP